MRTRLISKTFILLALPLLMRGAGPDPRVDALFARWTKPGSPGCALAVMRNGKIVYERGYGMADLDHDIPLTPESVFHVASVSKQFTAASIALLAQEGKLSLNDEARKYVAELPRFSQPVTIRQLVHHTSGLRDQWSLLGLAGWRYSHDLITDQDVLDMMSRQKALNFEPGSRFLYCNTGYTLLAQIAARVSNQSFREFTVNRFFEPLGMTSTHFRDDHGEIVKNQAYGYEPAGEGRHKLSVTNFDTVGATSLLTTVRDLAKWDENFYSKSVGGAELIAQLQEPGRLDNGEELDYAFGLRVGRYRWLRTVEHSGSDAGYRAHLVRFPEQHFSVACLCNSSVANPLQLSQRVADIYLASELAPARKPEPAITLSKEDLARYAGVYWNREQDSVRRIALGERGLELVERGENAPLQPLAANRFRVAARATILQFEPGRLRESDGSTKPDAYGIAAPFTPSGEALREYTGSYVSDEMEAVWRIAVEEDKLMLHRLRAKPAALAPGVADVFQVVLGNLRFVRDSQGKVSGLVVNTNRVRNFRLVRTP
ncbi:MAG: serine hydrolase domain-containing protein [Bryobacteraceae bacterium]